MTDQQEQPVAPQAAPAPRKRRGLIIGSIAAVALLGAGAAAFAGAGHFGHRGMMRDFIEYRTDRVLTDIGASDVQKAKLKTLVSATIDEVRPERGERRAMRDEALKLLEAPTIDRAAIEALRVKHVAEMDARSKVIAKAIGDAAEILTPDQRKKLADELEDFGPGDGPGRW